MQKRLFIALPFPKTVLKALSKYRDGMGRETPYLRWTPVENLHITALFLGDVAERDIARVEETVEAVCQKTKPFSLVCGGAHYAPAHRPPTMVWLAFEESRPFSAFARRLSDVLALLAPAMDYTQWKAETPHVTVARFQRKVLPHKLRRLRQTGLEGTAISISSCELMESQLTPSGPIYCVIRDYPFATQQS